MTPQEAKKCLLWNTMEDLNLCALVEFSQKKLTGVDESPCTCDSGHDFAESCPPWSKQSAFRTQSVLSIGLDTSCSMYIYNPQQL